MSNDGQETTTEVAQPSNLLDGNIEDPETVPAKEKKFPKSVFFIIGNEFCERFSYYGMRTVLTLYLTDQLNFSDDTATVIFHVFASLCYFMPLFGAMLADSAVGKFNTILYVSIIYSAGNIVLALASTPPLHFPMMEISMLGLAMIAVGTGGIKPCVSAYGGDQFDQDQVKQRQRFFSIFYFSINAGSLISTFLTPVFRADVKCFGGDTCFPLAFGVPAALMVVAVIFFACGKRLYKNVPQTGSVLVRVFGCVGHALRRRAFGGKSGESTTGGTVVARDHWLEYADDQYDKKFIRETRAALRVMYLYLPLPLFWALYDQQGSRWTLQATQMDGALSDSYNIQPDQMQVVNAVLILIFIPLFEAILYPLFARCNVLVQPLRRLFWGGMLAALAFLIAAAIEVKLDNAIRAAPSAGHFDVTFVNALPCDVNLTMHGSNNSSSSGSSLSATIKSHQALSQFGVELRGSRNESRQLVQLQVPNDCVGLAAGKEHDFLLNFEGESAYVSTIGSTATKDQLITVFSEKIFLKKSTKGHATVRIVYNLGENFVKESTFRLELSDGHTSMATFQIGNLSYGFTKYSEVDPAKYRVRLNATNTTQPSISSSSATLLNGGVYSLLVTNASDPSVVVFVEMDPNSLSMLWQVPQYVVITMAEILFSITGLEFSYSQAPLSMKSVLQAAWLMTTAVGDLIVVIVAEAHFFDKQFKEFLLFAGLMVIVMFIFALMAYSYKYVDADEWVTVDGEEENDENKSAVERTKAVPAIATSSNGAATTEIQLDETVS